MMPASERTIIDFLEDNLGPIAKVYGPVQELDEARSQILSFKGKPFSDSDTLVSVGLSHHLLHQPNGPDLRQELVLCKNADSPNESEVASLLEAIVSETIERHTALLHGEVLGPAGPIVNGSSMEGFVCANPWYWDDAFWEFQGMDPPVYLVWLIPVSGAEAKYIRQNGINAFEKLIEENEPDLVNLFRSSLVAAD